VSTKIEQMEKKFSKFYNKRLYVHHYEEYLGDTSHFEETRQAVKDLVSKYQGLEKQQATGIRRLKPLYV